MIWSMEVVPWKVFMDNASSALGAGAGNRSYHIERNKTKAFL